jgi:hypothetical protein
MRTRTTWPNNCPLLNDSSFSFASVTISNSLGTAAQKFFCIGKKRFLMNSRSLRILTFLAALPAALFAASYAFPQTQPFPAKPTPSTLLPAPHPADSNSTPPACFPARPPIQARRTFLPHLSEKKFIFLSAGVYTAAILDMHQTLAVRSSPWWYETDPLAKPFVHLPAPAYYATGLALATGVNWLSWKMSHSRRWHKLAPIPQVLSITGNLYGYHTNRF